MFMLSSSIDSSEGTTSSWIKYLDSLLGGGGGASSTSIKPVSSSTKFLPKHHRKHIKPSAAAVVDSSMMEHGSLKIMAARLLMCAKDLSVAFAETLDSPADVLNLESKVSCWNSIDAFEVVLNLYYSSRFRMGLV